MSSKRIFQRMCLLTTLMGASAIGAVTFTLNGSPLAEVARGVAVACFVLWLPTIARLERARWQALERESEGLARAL